MRRIHLWAGALTVGAFIVTGQFMRHHQPPLATLSDAERLMFRSRHIYILAAGLVNLMLGLYATGHAPGWRRTTQNIGSLLLIGSIAPLLLAFALEPRSGFQPEMRCSAIGLYALFAGCMAHALSSVRSHNRL